MAANKSKFTILFGVLAVLGGFFYFDLGQYLTIDYFKTQQAGFEAYYAREPVLTIVIYFCLYVLTTALSFPGAAVLTLAGGALFGFLLGTLLVSFASTLGATAAFLMARFFLRDYVQTKFSDRLRVINDGVKKEGEFYLFTMRLVPLVPFFVINLAMGLTPIKTWRFFIVSQIGMLLGTAVYVNAGTQIAQIDSLTGIISPSILASFVLLGILPILAKKILDFIKAGKALRRFKTPKKYDYNLVVIGAGAAGLISSYIAAVVKAKVALIEKNGMGGDCLNTGCVPSKALIKSAKIVASQHKANEYGLKSIEIEFSFSEVMERVQRIIGEVAPHDSVERYEGLGVECIKGQATIKTPYEVEVGGRTLTTKNIIIATGARPFIPPIPGIDDANVKTSDSIWGIRTCPKRLLVLGGGPIGAELAQSFHRLGSKVTIVEMAPRILIREDEEVSKLVTEKFLAEGITVLSGHKATQFMKRYGREYLICETLSVSVEVEFDMVLVAIGRKPNVEGFGAKELGIELNSKGQIAADPYLRTNFPNIFVCGDVSGDYQFTHVAGHEAWYASVNALFRPFRSFAADYRVIPMATYTDPEVARVGLNELEAKQKGVSFEVTRYGIDDLDRAIADSTAEGFVKVLTVPGKDKILGVTIVGHHAGDLLAEFVLAMKYHIGLNKILGTIHAYPTLAEANKSVAGVWKKARTPEKLLSWVQKFHSWRRGD